MIVAYTSDLHSDINNSKLMPLLCDQVKDIRPDVFIIAGDISNSIKNFDITLKNFKDLDCTKIMVPGNHDIWVESKNALRKGRDSFFKYYNEIPEICIKNKFLYPIVEPFIIKDVAIVGSIGWYDYSFQDERLKDISYKKDYDNGEFGFNIWSDTKFAVWLRYPESKDWKKRRLLYRNEDVFKKIFSQLEETVKKVPKAIKRIIIVLHTSPFRECIIPKDGPCPFDAYEGSLIIGNFIENLSENFKISVISGHRHIKTYLRISSNIDFYRSPVGYIDDNDIKLEDIAEGAIGIFEI